MSFITLSNRLSFVLLVCSGFTVSAHAQIALNDNFTISGFGSFTATRSNNATPVFVSRDITDEWCFDCDSTLGVQADWLLGHSLRATVQLVKRPQDNYSSPELERAFIEYSTESARFKLGRLRTPLFIMSEYYFVSSAYPWIRLPAGVYSNNLGITHYDGASADFSFWLGDEHRISMTPFAALPSDEKYELYGQSFNLDVTHAAGVTVELYHEDNVYRLAYVNADVEQIFNPANRTEHEIDIYSLGLSYYLQQFHFQAEVILMEDVKSNWYASLDYHWGEFTPYFLFGQSRRSTESNTYSIGARYDWTDRFSSSIEWQRVIGEDDIISGHFTLPQDPTKPFTTEVDIFSVGISFTF